MVRLGLSLLLTILFGLNSNCDDTVTLLSNVKISYYYRPSQTYFMVSTPLGNGVSVNNAWLGIGLNTREGMEGADVVVCTNLLGSTSVQRYKNIFRNSILMDSNNPTLGLSNTSLVINGANMQCSFTRDNINSNQNYYNLNNGSQAHIIVAYGQGGISNHGNNKYASPNTYLFTYSPSNKAINIKNKHYLILLTLIVYAIF